MKDRYERAYIKTLAQLEQIAKNMNIRDALNKTLPNDDDETDEAEWILSSINFGENNKKALKEWLK